MKGRRCAVGVLALLLLAARITMFEQMQDIVMREAPSAPLYQPVWSGLYGKNVGGYYCHPVWLLQFHEMWKLDGT